MYTFKKIGDTYAGGNKDGLRSGFGYYTFKNGDYDIGEYKKDLLDGYVVNTIQTVQFSKKENIKKII